MSDSQPKLKVLSLGWGVQSFTLAAMSALGELPKLDLLIHADTSWEREATYRFAEKYTPWLESKGLTVISACSLSARNPERDATNIHVPAYLINPNGTIGKLNRQCTSRWKIDVVRSIVRQELKIKGLKPIPGIVEQWLGISWDEAHRAKNSEVKYIEIRHPFLEKQTRMKRTDCLNWLQDHGFDIPVKSACVHCAFHNQNMWENLKRENGPDWKTAVKFDEAIRNKPRSAKSRIVVQHFVHRSARPLIAAVPLPEDIGYTQPDLMPGPGCDTAGYCWD